MLTEHWIIPAMKPTMRRFILIILTAVAMGCAPDPATRQAAPGGGILDEAGVLAIARAAVAANDTWVERAEFAPPQRQPDGSWRVWVWRQPATPGGHRCITLDANGTVTGYRRGV